jgi:hypothetical protein
MFHVALVAGITSVVSAGTFVNAKLQGETNEQALESTKKVLSYGISVATLGGFKTKN